MKRKKEKRITGLWAFILVFALVIGMLPVNKMVITSASATEGYGLRNPVLKGMQPPEGTSHGLSNPRNDSGTVTWDCVYFGSYWKNDTNGDGTADKNDEKEPIKWRVLSADGDDAFLLADTNLDVQRYNDTPAAVTWETCTMRSWLNGYGAESNLCGIDYSDNNFLDNAFTESEQAAIKDTTDKVYLLSISEVLNPSYGFSKNLGTETREAKNTAYVAARGETNSWWLRSPDSHGEYAADVFCGNVDYNGSAVDDYDIAVRPALHLNLSSSSAWRPAGEVTSEGGEMVATWDCVYFGNYPQSDAAGAISDPIKWRVLSVDGDDAFLLADTNLDMQRYNDTNTDVTWETCMMRTWLNSSFLNKAFSASEQMAIKDTEVVNEDNPLYGTEGGNDTMDKVYLLSISEALNPSYGFASTKYDTATREAVNTAYVAAGGETKYTHTSSVGSTNSWWLRSPGFIRGLACCVEGYWENNGIVYQYGRSDASDFVAVRPALHLNLSFSSAWRPAGQVTSEREEISTETPASPEPPVETAFPSQISVPGGNTSSIQTVAAPSSAPAQDVLQKGENDEDEIALAKVTAFKLKAKKKALQASWKKVSAASGYEIWCSMSKRFKKKSVRTTKKTKITVGKLKAKKAYFVKVRAYTVKNEKKVYGAWSNLKKMRVR